MASDFLILIDANAYLDLYRIVSGRKLLKPLLEQRDHIFVTLAVADEVRRNKLQVAADFLEDQFKKAQVPSGLPDHLFDVLEGGAQNLRETHKTVQKVVEQLNKDLATAADQILRLISRSEDEVSKALGDLLATPVKPTDDELKQARARQERGNPPGKKSDALGDQLTWEQLLTNCKEKTKVWIISRDSDYCTKRAGKLYLNAFLFQDLRALRSPAPDVFCFDNILDGVKHFVETTKTKSAAQLTPEDSQAIEKELNYLTWLKRSSSEESALIDHWYGQRARAAWVAATGTVGPSGSLLGGRLP